MKKTLSILFALTILVSSVFAIPFSARADGFYSDRVITQNIETIKNYICQNGFINGNGDYTLQYYTYDNDYDYYYLMIVNSRDNSLKFKLNYEDGYTEDLLGIIEMDIVPANESMYYVETAFWISSYSWSDLGGHAYIDRNFVHYVDEANFYIDYNDMNVSFITAYNAFNAMLSMGFENWNYMLNNYLNMNMSSVGFRNYCKSHNSVSDYRPATLDEDGYYRSECSTCGKITGLLNIYRPATFTLSKTSYEYDGKAKKPTLTVKDSTGILITPDYYTLSYPSGRKNVGKYTIKVNFFGDYSGTKTVSFKINPKNTSITGLTAGSKKFTVKLKKYTTQTTGYEIQYSTNSKFKSAKKLSMKNTETSKTISKLKSKQKYYVRVRTYKTVNGTKFYSSWSSSKTVTTK